MNIDRNKMLLFLLSGIFLVWRNKLLAIERVVGWKLPQIFEAPCKWTLRRSDGHWRIFMWLFPLPQKRFGSIFIKFLLFSCVCFSVFQFLGVCFAAEKAIVSHLGVILAGYWLWRLWKGNGTRKGIYS